MKRRRLRRNGWTKDDKMLAAVGVVAVVGIALIIREKKEVAVAGLRGMRGLGAYFQNQTYQAISGLGSNYVSVR